MSRVRTAVRARRRVRITCGGVNDAGTDVSAIENFGLIVYCCQWSDVERSSALPRQDEKAVCASEAADAAGGRGARLARATAAAIAAITVEAVSARDTFHTGRFEAGEARLDDETKVDRGQIECCIDAASELTS
jgi:hypothetical protein